MDNLKPTNKNVEKEKKAQRDQVKSKKNWDKNAQGQQQGGNHGGGGNRGPREGMGNQKFTSPANAKISRTVDGDGPHGMRK